MEVWPDETLTPAASDIACRTAARSVSSLWLPQSHEKNNIPLVLMRKSQLSSASCFFLNLSRNKFTSKWMSLLFRCLLCSWAGVTTKNRGVTAKLVMLAERGRRHGCCHYLLPCNFPTSCLLDKNRKKANCWILPLWLWCCGLVGWWRTSVRI